MSETATDKPAEQPTQETRRKVVNIGLLFSADSDDEALQVKKAVSAALAPWPKIALQFQIQEAPPRFKPPQE